MQFYEKFLRKALYLSTGQVGSLILPVLEKRSNSFTRSQRRESRDMTNTVNSTKKRKQKRSPALIAGMILLICAVILMITLAMFTSFDEVTNVFEAGKVDIILTETKWHPGDGENVVPEQVIDKNPRITNNEKMVDTYVFLKVVVPYVDTSGENDTNQLEKNSGTQKGILRTETTHTPLYKFVVTEGDTDTYDTTVTDNQRIHNGWYLLRAPQKDETKKTYTYIYAHVATNSTTGENNDPAQLMPLKAGFSTQYPLFDKIRVVNFNEKNFNYNRDYNIYIEAYGIQANFLQQNNTTTNDPVTVWNILQNNYTNI